tara:strand:- start:1265 stop:2239 length:975 start_codon:yes stop_codon:yes gene_type:complete
MKPVKSKKYDFDIDVTSNTYAGELALPYVTAAVLGAETINKNRVRLMEGIVGKAVINGLSFTDVIQAAGCSGADGGDLTLTTQVLTLNDLMVKEVICRKTILPTFVGAQGRMRRDGNIPPTFSEFLMSALAAQTGTSLENLMWQGATTTFPLGFLSNDGVIDEDGIDASACKDFIEHDTAATAWSSTTILGHMSGVFDAAQAVPGILQKPGCGFYLSYEAYAFFLQAMAAQNTGPGYNQAMEGATYLGYPVYPTPGIPNAVDVMVFTYPDNLVVGTNAYSGNEQASLIPVYQYDGSDNVKASLDFSVGVQVAVPTDGVVGFNFT